MDSIVTKHLVIQDDNGVARITLTTDGTGNPSLTLQDSLGAPRVAIQVVETATDLEATVTVRAGNGGHVARLSAGSDGHAALTLMRKDAQPLVILDVEAGDDARPCLSLFNPHDEVKLDDHGKPLGHPQLMCYLTVTEEGEPYLQLFDETESPTFRFPFYAGDLSAMLDAEVRDGR